MDEREKNLPKWAQELISDLRLRMRVQSEQLTAEVVKLRPQVELLKMRNDALMELLSCAAKGGHLTASDIIETLAGYELRLVKSE